MRAVSLVFLGALAMHAARSPARADENDPVAAEGAAPRAVHHVEPPPRPEDQGSDLLLDVRGAAVVPVYVRGLCPSGHECVMNAGIGIGVTVEQRWPNRFGLLLSYDAWVVDSDSLFEVGLMHSFRIGGRYMLDTSLNVHPYIELCIAFLAFGDPSQVSAIGGAGTAGGGVEVEISDSIALILDAELWVFGTGGFLTRDGVQRGAAPDPNLAVQISIGLEVLLGTL